MEEYIRKAFKSLEDLKVEIEPVKSFMREDVEIEEPVNPEEQTVRDLFEEESSYILTHNFEDGGLDYVLFLEGLHDGESCDILFEEFDINNIDSVLFEVLDAEHEFIGSILSDDLGLDSLISDVILKASKVINGESEEEVDVEVKETEDEDANHREFVSENPEEKVEVTTKLETEESLKESQSFSLQDEKEVEEAEKVLDKESEDAVEQIVDASAESKEDLKKSYIGSIILQCPTCKTMMYKDPDQLVKVEGEEELYNIDEECPHCGAKDGFEIVGQVASLDVNPDEEPEAPVEEEEPKEEEPEVKEPSEPMPELKFEEETPEEKKVVELKPAEESLEENINDVLAPSYKALEEAGIHFHVEGGKFEFDDEEDANKGLEILTGIHGEDKVRKDGFNVIVEIEETLEEEKHICPKCGKEPCECKKEEECEEECKMGECKLESLDETKFDNLVTKYLKETYSNVKTYRTTSAGIDESANKIVLEGTIAFKSGKEKNTKFIFEAKEINHKKQIKLVGINETFAKTRAFTLLGALDNNKLLSESLSYHYTIGDKKVRGKSESLRKR